MGDNGNEVVWLFTASSFISEDLGKDLLSIHNEFSFQFGYLSGNLLALVLFISVVYLSSNHLSVM